MKLSVRNQGDITIAAVAGELTHDSVARFREVIDQACAAGCRDFVVDLRQMTGVDSAGLEAFTALHRRCEEQLGLVRFCGADPAVSKIFEVTRLDHVLAAFPTIEEALAAFA